MSEEPYMPGGAVVAESLAGQLGTDPIKLAQGEIDMRRFSIIETKELPFLLYGMMRSDDSPFWKKLIDGYLNLKTSVGGRGRRDIIQMEQVSHGGQADIRAELEALKPGWLNRNVLNRNWQQEAIDEGKV